jgi:hypothetical protein
MIVAFGHNKSIAQDKPEEFTTMLLLLEVV